MMAHSESIPMSSDPPPDRRGFGVAIMCALPLEATAVAGLFEQQWDSLHLDKDPNDPNAYSIGSIERHNVVLVHMPRMGKVPSALVAAHLNRSFPNLGLVLVVGICGGVPLGPGKQRLLGDIIISDGIVQYDMGKQLADRYVKILPTQQPGFNISSVLKKLQTSQERALLQKNIFENLQDLQRKPELDGSAEYPGQEWDKVFRSDYLHRHRGTSDCTACAEAKVCDESVKLTCDELGCSEEWLETRPTRSSHRPAVHFGLVASGDTVVRSGKFRDEIARQTDAIAFEMEGAGMCTEFSSFLVIKSICDYADSHKNKKFQDYAAATAAAAAKEFLKHWAPQRPNMPSTPTAPTASPNRAALPAISSSNFLTMVDHTILGLLETTPYRDRKDRNPDRIRGTCMWFLNHPIFRGWKEGDSRALWVSADPGCGKSVLAKFLVNDVLSSTAMRTTCYFFFKDDFEDQRNALSALSCILHQLFKQRPALFSEDVRAQLHADANKLMGSFVKLWHILLDASGTDSSGEILCVFDALDECEEKSRSLFTRELQSLHHSGKYPNLRFLLTSRPFGKIKRGFQLPYGPGLSVVHLGGENDAEAAQISDEIDVYIRARVPSVCASLNLSQQEQDFMLGELLRVEHRTYLWVYLTLEHVERIINIDNGGIMKALSELPKSVDEAYERILSLSSNTEESRKILQVIVAAERPLTIREMNFVLLIQSHHRSYGDLAIDHEERFHGRLRDTCGLFVRIVDRKLYLLHQTAREFLVRTNFETRGKPGKPVAPARVPGDRCWNWKQTIDLDESNYLLAKICLWHLHFLDVNMDAGDQTQVAEHLFLSYSATHFAHHVRRAIHQTKKDKRLTKLLVAICHQVENSCPVWYRVHSPATEPRRIALIFASKLGLTPAVKVLIKERECNLDARDSVGWTALSWAVAKGFPDVSRILIKGWGLDRLRGLFTKRKAVFDDSVLISACKNPWGLEMVRLLLDSGADVYGRDINGHTPLTAAVDAGQVEIVGLLHDRHPGIMSAPYYHEPLALAAEHGDLVMTELLLDGGATVRVRDRNNHTPMMAAVANGHLAIVKLLCDRFPNILSEPTKHRPLFLAWQTNNHDMMKLLLARGASPDTRDEGGIPLLVSALRMKDRKAARFLLDNGADVNSKDNEGQSALSLASWGRSLDIVKVLLDYGADVNSKDNEGESALSWASERGSLDIVKVLWDYGADVNNKDNEGRSALSRASERGSLDIVKALLDHGADVNSKDNEGESALLRASRGSWIGSLDIVKALLDYGADVE
ncbi:ankyrin repeat-containing domain protein [Cladorrhinum sp. PSN332]|nr:ankyrin repeat-containing domain protein [Cladorrhinum sp. PSN332]